MASDFMDKFRFNTENAPDVFYIQNLKKKPTKTVHEYDTQWRSEAAKVSPALEEEQMNKFFVKAQDLQYYERLMVIKNHKFSDIIKMGERIEEGIKSGMNGYTIYECRTLKDKIQTLIDTKVILAKETAPNVRNNPLPNHRGEGVNVIEIDEEWDPKGSIGLIREGDNPKTSLVTLTPIVVQTQAPFKVEVTRPFTVMVAPTPSYMSDAIPWDYVAKSRRKGKAKMEETGAAQGMTRTDRVYTPEHLGGTRKEAASKPLVVEARPDDLWRKLQAREYSVFDHLNKTPAQISILSLQQNSGTHKNGLMKVLSEAYVPTNITSGEMANMVRQVLESHKITFQEDELPPEGLSHNKALHITVQFEDKFIARVLIDGGSSLNICPLTTLKRLDKGLHEIWMGNINVKAFDGSQRATIGEINLSLQMGPTWLDVEFQDVKFEWNHQEVIIHGDGSNPIYTNQTVPVIENWKKLGGETYHRIERVSAIENERWWSNKKERILLWIGYEPGKGLGKNLQGITKPVQPQRRGTTFGLGYEYTWQEYRDWSPPWRGPYYSLEQSVPPLHQTFHQGDMM
ncbi:uncharacterized protein [Nicotiana tomentosiformis]|uniref:uncharacterized protein n=1 Tax=Nicotiana tomentosiformis TaxID=4098 RepID=UPI00388C97CA